jgi:hypothetical protein
VIVTPPAHEEIDNAIRELDRLRKNLKKKSGKQVHSRDEQDIIKATGLSWFNSHLAIVQGAAGEEATKQANALYQALIALTDRATSRSRYDTLLKTIKSEISSLRGATLLATKASVGTSTDAPPNFRPLIADAKMQQILSARWTECVRCIEANAPMSATVMMGGLLETLLLGRFNRETNKQPIFRAAAAPKDKAGKPEPFNKWMLKHYLDVAHELAWINRSAKDVGEVLRDYRNYIHPYKQARDDLHLDSEDARLFWEIAKGITRQLIAKVK